MSRIVTIVSWIQLTVIVNRVHRVFVVDNEHDYKPIAVISIADVLNYMMLGKK